MSNLLEKASIITTPTAYSDGVLHSVKPEQTLGSELLSQNVDLLSDFLTNSGGVIVDSDTFTTSGGVLDGIKKTNFFVVGKKYKLIILGDTSSNGFTIGNLFGDGNEYGNGFGVHYFTALNSGLWIKQSTIGTTNITQFSIKEATNADFTFTRNDAGTRVNASGNIESVGVDLPRIDYRGGSGSLLLEPEATNTATYSNDFTTGDIFVSSSDPALSNVVLTSAQATSPDGNNNAWKLADDNGGGIAQCGLNYFSTNVISENYNTVSLFVKKQGNNDWMYINNFGYDATDRSWFNISNGTLGTVSSGHTASIDDYGNGWYRVAVTFATEFDLAGSVNIRLATSDGATNITRDGTSGVYIYGLQAESHATREYATSYIPTSGGTVTRGADSAIDAGSSDLISSTEGVLYAELKSISEFVDSPTTISINNNNTTNRLLIYKIAGNNKLQFQIKNPSDTVDFISATTNTTFDKVAIKYKSLDYAVWINGVEVFTDTITSSVPAGLTRLDFSEYDSSSPFQGNVKCVAVFKEALTDAELTCLTTI